MTSSWRRNDVATSFWHHNDVIIASCPVGILRWWLQMSWHLTGPRKEPRGDTTPDAHRPAYGIMLVADALGTNRHEAISNQHADTTVTILSHKQYYASYISCCIIIKNVPEWQGGRLTLAYDTWPEEGLFPNFGEPERSVTRFFLNHWRCHAITAIRHNVFYDTWPRERPSPEFPQQLWETWWH